jgi:hypothetical protein
MALIAAARHALLPALYSCHSCRSLWRDTSRDRQAAFGLLKPRCASAVTRARSMIGAVIGGLMLLRNKPFQSLDGVRAFERLVLAVEAVHLDAASRVP